MATIVCRDGGRRDGTHRRIASAATGLGSMGVGSAGVALCLRNDIEFYEASLAAGALGAYAIPINWHFTADEVRYILTDSGAKAIVIHADLLSRMRDALPDGLTRLVVPTSPAVRAAYGVAAAEGEVPFGELTGRGGSRVSHHAPSRPARCQPPSSTPRAPPAGRRACAGHRLARRSRRRSHA